MNEEEIDLFEGVDLKNLQAKVVPAREIYPAILKCLGIVLCGLYNVFIVFSIDAYGLQLNSGIRDCLNMLSWSLFCTVVAGTIPTLVLWGTLFRYQMFKRSIAIYLKHGDVICQALAKVFYLVIASWFGVALIIFVLYKPFDVNKLVTMAICSNIIFMFLAFCGDWILRMEVARRGINLGVKTINDLLAKG